MTKMSCVYNTAYQNNASDQNKKEDQIVPANMPMLQIRGGPLRDTNKTVHESVQAFFSAFEAQLRSRSLDLNRHWERLIWTTLDAQQHTWVTRRLAGQGYTWEEAKLEIERMYGNPLYIYRKQFELSRKFQKPGQSLKLHTEEWQELAYEASCEPSPQTTFNYSDSQNCPNVLKISSFHYFYPPFSYTIPLLFIIIIKRRFSAIW